MRSATVSLPGARKITFAVDSTMYEGINAFPGGIYRDLDQVVRPNLYYHYSTPVCAQRWLDVCEDPAYGHQELIADMDVALPHLMAALRADLDGPDDLLLTSLGPGDGIFDEHLLRGLAQGFRLAGYLGLDFSFDLLRRAAHRLVGAEGLHDGFPLTFLCGDFTALSALDASGAPTAGARLFSLTGFTLGNYSEADLLERLRPLMHEGDYLLLDARIQSFAPFNGDGSGIPDRRQLAGSYDIDSVRRFVFGPVEVATMAAAEDVDIDIEITRSLTTVPKAVNLVIFCSDLDSTMRLTGEPVWRERLDLAVTTLYDVSNLLGWFPSVGLDPVWHESFHGAAFFLLKRV